MNWREDDVIVEFEKSLSDAEAEKFLPYVIMFHALKTEHQNS